MLGIIKDIIECPQCGMPAIKSDYHVTNEELVACDYCGYNHAKTLKGTKSYRGYGCIHYVKDDVETIVRLKEPLSLIGRDKIFSEISEKYDIKKSSFFVWDEETQKLDCIIGKKPLTLEEEYERQRIEAEYYAMIARGCESEDF